MSAAQPQPRPLERALLLLADRALHGLSETEQDELINLLSQLPDLDEHAFDYAAAALELAFDLPREPLPEALRQALLAEAGLDPATAPVAAEPVAAEPVAAEPVAAEPVAAEPVAAEPVAASAIEPPLAGGFSAPPKKPKHGRKKGQSGWLGWAVAALALALALAAWWPQLRPAAAPDISAERAALLATPGTVQVNWQAGPGDASGDVVWNNRQQRGFLRFQGLTANDPAKTQYQLWIVDSARDPNYPVDGGVFDAPLSDTPVLVGFRPALPVNAAQRFLITLEPAGGVVVSDRQRVVLEATP